MKRFYGFDLGDAESAVSVLDEENASVPAVLEVDGNKSFISAYALTSGGKTLIGENACYASDVIRRSLRFKSRFLTVHDTEIDVRSFSGAVLSFLKLGGNYNEADENLFYVGSPAGWDQNTRERYRFIFEGVGYPPLKIVSESRAALISACQSRHLQVGYDIQTKRVLVVDIGSSTTDFAFISSGREVEMKTGGEVYLGGGIMDELLLQHSLDNSPHKDELSRIFAESEPWRNYCLFMARKLKERYFTDIDYFKDNHCVSSALIHYGDESIPLKMTMNEEVADKLLGDGCEALEGMSFEEAFVESLRQVRENIGEEAPDLIFLTGGVSRMPAIRAWCIDQFPESIVITGSEPEFAVSRGLAWCGRIDEDVRAFRAELNEFVKSSVVEDIVQRHIPDLYAKIVDALVEPIISNVAAPVFDLWRSGGIRKLSEADEYMQREIESYLKSDEARQVLSAPVSAWLSPVSDEIEDHTAAICIRHNVPYSALSLSSYFSVTDIDVKIDARNVFAVEEITWLIDSVITVIAGLLCGGGGVALLSGGPAGILAGAAASALILALGKDKMEEALLKVDVPVPMRKLVPKNSFLSRAEGIADSLRESLYDKLSKEKNREISERMSGEIAQQIEQCLLKMAMVVEIPLYS